MSHGLKLLLMAAGAIITCVVVVVGFQLTKSGKSDTNKASEQYTSVMSNYDEVQLTSYEEMEVSGADVVNYIKENAASIVNSQINQIIVTTKASGAQTYAATTYESKTVEDLKNTVNSNQSVSTDVNYINPSGAFYCTITRNSNGMIKVVSFEQK